MTHAGDRHRALFPLLVFAAACGTAANAPTVAPTTVDSSGVSIVVNQAPQWSAATAWRVDSIPVTTIGGDESDPQQHFQYVRQAIRMADGRVVVVVGGELRWFGVDGKYIKTTTHAGQGPGEFRDIDGLLHMNGDSILAFGDFMDRKAATYGPEGALAHEELLDLDRFNKLGRWRECQMGVFPDRSRFTCQDDAAVAKTETNRDDAEGDPGPGVLRHMRRLYVVPATIDTAYRMGLVGGIEQFGVKGQGGRTSFVIHPFYSTSHIAAGGSPLRIALITNPEYNVEIWTPTGKLERIIRRTGGRRAPTAQERADAPAEIRKWMTRLDTAEFNRIIAAVPVPDSLPAAVGVVLGAAGEVVVQREGYLPSQKASLFDVFDPQGAWLGELRLPPRVRLLEMGSDFLLCARLDADDVAHVEVYRLHRT